MPTEITGDAAKRSDSKVEQPDAAAIRRPVTTRAWAFLSA